jgi:hypothetical protein
MSHMMNSLGRCIGTMIAFTSACRRNIPSLTFTYFALPRIAVEAIFQDLLVSTSLHDPRDRVSTLSKTFCGVRTYKGSISHRRHHFPRMGCNVSKPCRYCVNREHRNVMRILIPGHEQMYSGTVRGNRKDQSYRESGQRNSASPHPDRVR